MLVQAQSLTKHYGAVAALADCNLEVSSGEIIGLLGPNGAGKTTLLRTLMGYLKPTHGRATIDGVDCYRRPAQVHQRLSYLPGDARLPRRLTGRQVIRFFARLRRNGSAVRSEQFAERLQLDLSRRVAQMSTGMRQKLALAITLSPETPLLVLDEPTSNLDPSVRREVNRMIGEARDAGRTVMLSSHVLSEVEETCQRVIVLREGRLVDDLQMSAVSRQHRISARMATRLTPPPQNLAKRIEIQYDDEESVSILTPGDLTPILGWLAEQQLSELRIEPLGLATIYERHHPAVAP